jgi:hypothetical protein
MGNGRELQEAIDLWLNEPLDAGEAAEFKRSKWGTGIEAVRQEARINEMAIPTYGED